MFLSFLRSGAEAWVKEGRTNTPVDEGAAWIRNYFFEKEKVKGTSIPPVCFPAEKTTEFERKVWNALAKNVGFGQTITYGKLAELAVGNLSTRQLGVFLYEE